MNKYFVYDPNDQELDMLVDIAWCFDLEVKRAESQFIISNTGGDVVFTGDFEECDDFLEGMFISCDC